MQGAEGKGARRELISGLDQGRPALRRGDFIAASVQPLEMKRLLPIPEHISQIQLGIGGIDVGIAARHDIAGLALA